MRLELILKKILPKTVVVWLQHQKIAAGYVRAFGLASFAQGFRASSPTRVRIEPASACNLRCVHCPTGWAGDAGDPNRSLMEPPLFERVLSQIKLWPTVKAATFYFAGEPLLNRWLPDMLRRIKAETSVVSTQISTNGMLLTEGALSRLEGTGLDLIHVSIDGDSPEENDKIRRRSNYKKVRENIRRARERLLPQGTDVRIHNVRIMTEDRVGRPARPAQFLVDDFGPSMVDGIPAIRWPGLRKELVEQQGLRIIKKRDVGTKTGEGFCTMPFTETVVQANGNVTVCCYDITGELKMGSVHENTLQEIWNGPAYRKLRKAIVSFGLLEPLPETCRKCHIYSGEVVVQGERKQTQALQPLEPVKPEAQAFT